MSRDPYHDFKREVDSSLSQTHSLLSSYLRLLPPTSSSSSSRSPPSPTPNQLQLISEAHVDLQTTLNGLEADLEDLEDSVQAVEESGEMFGMSQEEVNGRRRFLDGVRKDVQDMRSQIASRPPPHPSDPFQDVPLSSSSRVGPGLSNYSQAPVSNNQSISHETSSRISREAYRDHDQPNPPASPYKRSSEPDLYEQEQQQMIMRQQDNTLDVIGGTLRGLGQMAGLIGREVGEQNE